MSNLEDRPKSMSIESNNCVIGFCAPKLLFGNLNGLEQAVKLGWYN